MTNIEKRSKGNIIITGASSGIGKSTARLLSGCGYRVLGTSRKKQKENNGYEMYELDISSGESIANFINVVMDRIDNVDVLINNAGTWFVNIAEETSLKEARDVFETNFFGVVRIMNGILPYMRKQKKGKIINIGSMASWIGEPGESFYAASKHALSGYTESIHYELKSLGISVTLIEPGAFKTNFSKGLNLKENGIPDYDNVRKAVGKTLLKSLETGDNPDKVARLILKIIKKKSPRLRYGIGNESHWIPYLKILLPQRLLDSLIIKGFGLDKYKK